MRSYGLHQFVLDYTLSDNYLDDLVSHRYPYLDHRDHHCNTDFVSSRIFNKSVENKLTAHLNRCPTDLNLLS